MIIRATASALPPHSYDSATVAAWCGSDETFLRDKVGISSRRFMGADESEFELAASACEKLLARVGVALRDIGLCIYVGQVRVQTIPHASALLQHRLGLPENCACFDMGLACSGYIYALSVAKSFMESGNVAHALLVTCDPYSRIMGRTNRNTVPLFGDAATATLLSLSGAGLEIGKTDLGTDGSGAAYLEFSASDSGAELHMNGRGIFNFAMRRIPESVERCLRLNEVTREDIDYFLFHQANAFMLRTVCEAMGIDKKKCPVRMENVANTVSSSIPLLLEEFLPRFQPGERVVMSGFGGGLSWGTTYATFKGECNDRAGSA